MLGIYVHGGVSRGSAPVDIYLSSINEHNGSNGEGAIRSPIPERATHVPAKVFHLLSVSKKKRTSLLYLIALWIRSPPIQGDQNLYLGG